MPLFVFKNYLPKEALLQRDWFSRTKINFDKRHFAVAQERDHKWNYNPSGKSKAKGANASKPADVIIDDLAFIKNNERKSKGKEQ